MSVFHHKLIKTVRTLTLTSLHTYLILKHFRKIYLINVGVSLFMITELSVFTKWINKDKFWSLKKVIAYSLGIFSLFNFAKMACIEHKKIPFKTRHKRHSRHSWHDTHDTTLTTGITTLHSRWLMTWHSWHNFHDRTHNTHDLPLMIQLSRPDSWHSWHSRHLWDT